MPESSKGLALLDFLIALVLFSGSVLLLAETQLQQIRSAVLTSQREMAVTLAADLFQRILSNPSVAIAQQASLLQASSESLCQYWHSSGKPCSPSNFAEDETARWLSKMQRQLPGATAVLCRDTTPSDGSSLAQHGCDASLTAVWTIKIWWPQAFAQQPIADSRVVVTAGF